MDIKEINRKTIEQFRAGGEIEGMHRERLLLLTTTGSKTGRPHTAPMMFVRDGERVLVIASNMGNSKVPDWCGNLSANNRVNVEIGEETYAAQAEPLTGDDYTRSWTKIKEQFPFFADHEKTANRQIPVIALIAT
jgi:deazaflavin-dependent oxidoreductase (nitroreductase family)